MGYLINWIILFTHIFILFSTVVRESMHCPISPLEFSVGMREAHIVSVHLPSRHSNRVSSLLHRGKKRLLNKAIYSTPAWISNTLSAVTAYYQSALLPDYATTIRSLSSSLHQSTLALACLHSTMTRNVRFQKKGGISKELKKLSPAWAEKNPMGRKRGPERRAMLCWWNMLLCCAVLCCAVL